MVYIVTIELSEDSKRLPKDCYRAMERALDKIESIRITECTWAVSTDEQKPHLLLNGIVEDGRFASLDKIAVFPIDSAHLRIWDPEAVEWLRRKGIQTST